MSLRSPHNQLFDKNLIDEKQFHQLEIIESGKLISLFYELRTLLYLGVLLFSTGVGILVYENIGSLGHILSIIIISALCIVCFFYSFKKQGEYSHSKVIAPTPYFDYILLLGCLLFISVFGYLQFLYGLLDESLEAMTLITSVLFFYIAYRFDHLGVLSLAITAFASFWGLSVSPQKWYGNDFFSSDNLYVIAIIFSLALAGISLFLEKREMKKHFTFSYINYCSLLFFVGTNTGLFNSGNFGIYLFLQLVGAAAIMYYATIAKSFLFLLYGFIFGYIAFTYLITLIMPSGAEMLWAYYLILSCGGFIVFIIKYRNYFKREE